MNLPQTNAIRRVLMSIVVPVLSKTLVACVLGPPAATPAPQYYVQPAAPTNRTSTATGRLLQPAGTPVAATTVVQPMDDYLSPPYFGRVYFGRIPFDHNSLTVNFFSSDEQYQEVWINGQPMTVLVNGQQHQQPIVRGAHRGRMANLIPPRAGDGRLMFDGPGAHGIEFWCYLDVPGVGLIEMHHGTTSHTIGNGGGIGSFCR